MDEILKQVVHIFADEGREQVDTIIAALLAMEKDASAAPQQVEELFRQAHSLKGSAGSLNLRELEALAHQLETAMTPVRRGKTALARELVDLALGAMEAVKLRLQGIVQDTPVGLAEVNHAIAALENFGKTASDSATHAASGPTPATLPSGVTSSATGSAGPVSDAMDTVRITAAKLQTIERGLDDLRGLSDRVSERRTELTQVHKALEQVWQDLRTWTRSQRGTQAESAQGFTDRLFTLLHQVRRMRGELRTDSDLAASNAGEMDENLRDLSMATADALGETLRQAIQVAARRHDKEINFVMDGGDTKVDRRLLDTIKSALMHVVRNAVDHGIEPTVVRSAIGKPTCATITLSVNQEGSDVVFTVRDDGRGIDVAAVRQHAISQGLINDATAAVMTTLETYNLLFVPGFSTASEVTELSGRGVGLDVVRDTLASLGGTIDVSSQPGVGACFTLRAPLTVVASDVVWIEDGGHSFAVAMGSIQNILRVTDSSVRNVAGRTVYQLDDSSLAVVRIARFLGLTEQHLATRFRILLVLQQGGRRAGVLCERIVGIQQLALRPLPLELKRLRLLNCAAVLPNGQAVFTLAPGALIDAAESATTQERRFDRHGRVLIVDDSITTRTLLRGALEAAGYQVTTAADGEEALRIVQSETIGLIISDVRMPRLDGYGLTIQLRANPRTKHVPVVLFSAMETDRGDPRASGADAYLSKSAFDRGELLQVVENLLTASAPAAEMEPRA